MGKKNVYAVRKGFKGVEFKGFPGMQEVQQYLKEKDDGKKRKRKHKAR